MVRSCAPEDREPRQVRKEGTVSGPFWAPPGRWAGTSQSERREEQIQITATISPDVPADADALTITQVGMNQITSGRSWDHGLRRTGRSSTSGTDTPGEVPEIAKAAEV